MRARETGGILLALLVSGCAYPPRVANPTGLSPEALSLKYVLDRGCFPYLLGHADAKTAMERAGLWRQYRLADPFSGTKGGFFFSSPYPGLGPVYAENGACTVIARGPDIESYREAVREVLSKRLGANEAEDRASGYKEWLPGQITACRHNFRYSYDHPPKYASFEVSVTPVDCAHDPFLLNQ